MDGILILFLLAIVGSVAALIFLRSGENLRFETGASQERVMTTAMSTFATKRNWEVVTSTDSSASFNYRRGANKLLLVFLLLFFIVPGIVYWILSGKKETVNVSALTQGAGVMVQIASNGWRGKTAGRSLKSAIGVSGGVVGLEEDETAPPSLSGGTSGTLEQGSGQVTLEQGSSATQTEQIRE